MRQTTGDIDMTGFYVETGAMGQYQTEIITEGFDPNEVVDKGTKAAKGLCFAPRCTGTATALLTVATNKGWKTYPECDRHAARHRAARDAAIIITNVITFIGGEAGWFDPDFGKPITDEEANEIIKMHLAIERLNEQSDVMVQESPSEDMTEEEKVNALVTEGGLTHDEAVEMLEDMGEL